MHLLGAGTCWELRVIRSLWAAYLRRGEYPASRYAEKLGYSYELVEYLDVYERTLYEADSLPSRAVAPVC